MKITKTIILLVVTLAFVGCDAQQIASTVKQSVDEDTIWIFAQINVPEPGTIDDYYYYGRVQRELYEQMIDGKVTTGFILFRDVRYWNNDDQIEKYEDNAETGDLTFRIEHIVRMNVNKGDPFILQKEEATASD